MDRFAQPFVAGWSVSGAVTTTKHGVYNYLTPGDYRSEQVGLFKLDIKARTWTNLSGGKAAIPCPENKKMVYDSKRDRLIVVSSAGVGADAKPAMYAWDLPGGKDWQKLDMAGELPTAFYRESVYIEKHDRILNWNTDGLFACDLAGQPGNKWNKVPGELPGKVKAGPNGLMVYDPGADVLVMIDGANSGPTSVWLMRYSPGQR